MAARNDGLTVTYTLTRRQPAGWTGGARRIDRSMLASVGPSGSCLGRPDLALNNDLAYWANPSRGRIRTLYLVGHPGLPGGNPDWAQ